MDANTRQRFAEIVSKIRGDRTIREFAAQIGVSHPSVADWEDRNSRSVPSQESIRKIAQACGMAPHEFLAHLENPREFNPIESAIAQINGASPHQLAEILRAIASRIERS